MICMNEKAMSLRVYIYRSRKAIDRRLSKQPFRRVSPVTSPRLSPPPCQGIQRQKETAASSMWTKQPRQSTPRPAAPRGPNPCPDPEFPSDSLPPQQRFTSYPCKTKACAQVQTSLSYIPFFHFHTYFSCFFMHSQHDVYATRFAHAPGNLAAGSFGSLLLLFPWPTSGCNRSSPCSCPS